MADAFETGDASYIAQELGVVARAKGMVEISRQTGLSREQLYRSFSERGNPTLKTTLAVMRVLGVDITAKSMPVSSVIHPRGAAPACRPRDGGEYASLV